MFCARAFAPRYFAPRYFPKVGATVASTDDISASFFQGQAEHMKRHHFPQTSSHFGHRHHHFSIHPNFAGA